MQRMSSGLLSTSNGSRPILLSQWKVIKLVERRVCCHAFSEIDIPTRVGLNQGLCMIIAYANELRSLTYHMYTHPKYNDIYLP